MKVLLSLLSLIAGTSAQCDCGAYDQCVSSATQGSQILQTCYNTCINQGSTTGQILDPNIVQCYNQRDAAKKQQKNAFNACLTINGASRRECTSAGGIVNPNPFPIVNPNVNPFPSIGLPTPAPFLPNGFPNNVFPTAAPAIPNFPNFPTNTNNLPQFLQNLADTANNNFNGQRYRGKRHGGGGLSRQVPALRTFDQCVRSCASAQAASLGLSGGRSFDDDDSGERRGKRETRVKRGGGGGTSRIDQQQCFTQLNCQRSFSFSGSNNAYSRCRNDPTIGNRTAINTQFCSCIASTSTGTQAALNCANLNTGFNFGRDGGRGRGRGY